MDTKYSSYLKLCTRINATIIIKRQKNIIPGLGGSNLKAFPFDNYKHHVREILSLPIAT